MRYSIAAVVSSALALSLAASTLSSNGHLPPETQQRDLPPAAAQADYELPPPSAQRDLAAEAPAAVPLPPPSAQRDLPGGAPSPSRLSRRSRHSRRQAATTGPLAANGFYMLSESSPDTYQPLGNFFNVAQSAGINGGRATNRQYVLVTFTPTPSGSTTCALQWSIPANMQFVRQYGATQLEIKTSTAFYPPFRPTWNNVIANNNGTLGSGVWGTVNVVSPSGPATINSGSCSNSAPAGAVGGGYGLAYVFKFADWVEQGGQPAAATFYAGSASVGTSLMYAAPA